jgi:hypothetical protein
LKAVNKVQGVDNESPSSPVGRTQGSSYSLGMSNPLTASDFWPLILKLPHEERVRLAKLALRAAVNDSSAATYAAAPPAEDEFSSDEEPLAWESQGWEEFSAPR